MLHATRLLAIGRIKAVVDDEGATHDLSCGDKDSAFTLVAESDDVFAFVDDEPVANPSRDDRNEKRGAHTPPEPAEAAETRDEVKPLRFYFFCIDDEDRHWLHGACMAQFRGVGVAAIELCPVSGGGSCHVRVPRGVRVIPVISAE